MSDKTKGRDVKKRFLAGAVIAFSILGAPAAAQRSGEAIAVTVEAEKPGAKIDRSKILRALANALADSGIDITGVVSETQLRQLLARRLGGKK